MSTEKKPTHGSTIVCRQEKKIAEMYKLMQLMEPIVLGTGPDAPGLNVTVPVLAENVSQLTINVNALTVSVTNLLEFQGREEARREQKERDRQLYEEKKLKSNRRLTLTLSGIMTLMMIASVLIAILA